MTTRLTKKAKDTFEGIKRISNDNIEFWSSRDLAKVLDYSDYRNFQSVIDKAKEACKNSGENVQNHFVEFTEMVSIGYGVKREIVATAMTRYACYLVVQNSNPSKTMPTGYIRR